MTVGSLSELIHTSGGGRIQIEDSKIQYGLHGDDNFEFIYQPNIPSGSYIPGNFLANRTRMAMNRFNIDSILVGGSGNDTYSLNEFDTRHTIIFDGSNSGGDSLDLGQESEYFRALISVIDNQHLHIEASYEMNDFADDFHRSILIPNWQSPENKIESFKYGENTFTYEEISSLVSGTSQSLGSSAFEFIGNLTWDEAIARDDLSVGESLTELGLTPDGFDTAISQIQARSTELEQLQPRAVERDLNSDQKNDLLLYNPQFQWSGVAFMDGDEVVGSTPLWNGWKSVGTSDFNGDGNTDVVVQNVDNDWFGILYMDGAGGIQSSQSILGWQEWDIIGTGHFNDDGTEDILVGHRSQPLYGVWYMGGSQGNEIVGARGVDVWEGWDIKASGDFDHDGSVDLVIQHQTEGWIGISSLDATADHPHHQLANPRSVDGWSDWNVLGTTDLNNDNQTDLLVQHKSQPWNGVLYMSGYQVVGSSGLSGWDGWQITA